MGMDQIGLSFIITIIVFLVLIGMIIWGIRELVIRIKLARSGVKVDGHITDHLKKSGYDRYGKSSRYYLIYDYDYHGSTYSRKEKVRSDLYYELNNGDEVSVSCLPKDPKTARVGYKIPDSENGMTLAVTFLLIGIAGVIILLAIATGFALLGLVAVGWL